MQRVGVTLAQSQTSRVKTMLADEAYGTHELGFKCAGDMLRKISDANPGGITDLWLREQDPLKKDFLGLFLLLPFSIVRHFQLDTL